MSAESDQSSRVATSPRQGSSKISQNESGNALKSSDNRFSEKISEIHTASTASSFVPPARPRKYLNSVPTGCLDDNSTDVTATSCCVRKASTMSEPNSPEFRRSPGVRKRSPTRKMSANMLMFGQGKLTGSLDALPELALKAFRHGEYLTSLRCFQNILRTYPECCAEVRMWIGICFLKLGNYEKGRTALQRALQLNEQCLGAKIGLCLLSARNGLLSEALSTLKVCFEQCSTSSSAFLAIFGDDFCLELDLASAVAILDFTLEHSSHTDLHSSFAWAIGRRYHVEENYDQAFEFYQTAAERAPSSFALPWYGLGQVYLHQQNWEQAIDCLEKVLMVEQNCVEAMRLLGLLYNRLGRRDMAPVTRDYLRQAAVAFPGDTEVLLKLAEELEGFDKEEALTIYIKVYEALKTTRKLTSSDVPILNNISALYFALNRFEESRQFLTIAMNHLDTTTKHGVFRSINITLLYNQGRLFEVFSDPQPAQDCYMKILSAQPAYIDACLRLGHVAAVCGEIDEANGWFDEAAQLNADDPEALICQGDLLMKEEAYPAACAMFDLVLKNPRHADDSYALLKCGNACVEMFRSGLVADGKERKQLVEKSFSLFQRVLTVDPTNLYAANGLGVILASIGFGNAALELFRLVHECDPHVVDAVLNLGHMLCAMKDFDAAIPIYQECITLCPLSSECHVFLARAFYLTGDLKRAERTLQTALRFSPANRVAKFNLGVSLKAMAIVTLKAHDSSLVAVGNAVEDLRKAETIFKDLLVEDTDGLDEKRLRKEAAVTFNFLNQSASHLERAERMEAVSAKKQKRTANQLLLTEQFSTRKNSLGKRGAGQSASSSGSKGKMARPQARTEDCSPLKKRSHKNAQLEESMVDFRQVLSNAQREPQRKRVKAVTNDVTDRRRRKFAGRKRRELEIELNTVSSDDDLSPHFRPARRKYLGPLNNNVMGRKISRIRTACSSDVCSSVDASETEMFVFAGRSEPATATESPIKRHDSVSQKRGQSSSEKPMVLKRFLKARSDETISPAVAVVEAAAVKRNLSEGDTALIAFVGVRDPVSSTGLIGSDSSLTNPVMSSADSDDSVKRHNTDCEPESRKRRSSLQLVDGEGR